MRIFKVIILTLFLSSHSMAIFNFPSLGDPSRVKLDKYQWLNILLPGGIGSWIQGDKVGATVQVILDVTVFANATYTALILTGVEPSQVVDGKPTWQITAIIAGTLAIANILIGGVIPVLYYSTHGDENISITPRLLPDITDDRQITGIQLGFDLVKRF